jgi:MarR family transcriptional regulator, organic hydroperoxide resistance regulator
MANTPTPDTHADDQGTSLDRLAHEMVRGLDEMMRVFISFSMSTVEMDTALTMHEARAINLLGGPTPVTMSDFAADLRISLPTATHLVDRLVVKDLVARRRSDEDRRVVLIELSERGRKRHQTFLGHRLATTRKVLEMMAPDDRARAVGAVGQLASLAAATAWQEKGPRG